MKISVNRIHFPVTALGPGRRLGIWLQGCTLACPGCVSRDTWARDDTRAIEVSDLVEACRRLAPEGPDGITITGGEPFEQPDALHRLLIALRAWSTQLSTPFDILSYSGFAYDRLETEHAALLRQLDALIPEPFNAAAGPGARWRGSANQPLVVFSELGRHRFRDPAQGQYRPSMQVVVDDRLWMIGIPRVGDLPEIERRLRDRGVALEKVSWRP